MFWTEEAVGSLETRPVASRFLKKVSGENVMKYILVKFVGKVIFIQNFSRKSPKKGDHSMCL